MDINTLILQAIAYRHDMPKPDTNGNVTVSATFVDNLTRLVAQLPLTSPNS